MRRLITLASMVCIITPPAAADDGDAVALAQKDLNAIVLFKYVKHSIVRVEVARTDKVGTGFVFDPSGLILTNYHVVSPVKAGKWEQVHVEFVTDTEEGKPVQFLAIGAVVQAVDYLSDLAVLRLVINDASDLRRYGILNQQGKFQALAFAKNARVGEWVLAVGFSGLKGMPTVSRGLVSAVGRDTQRGTLSGLIQTDASINPGNSGGPLLNAAGEVVGINSMRLTGLVEFKKGIHYEVFSGISFARSYETVATFARQLKEKGRVDRIDLGLAKSSNFTALKREGSFFPWDGVLVEEFKDQSVLKVEKGLKKDDVIFAIIAETSDGQSTGINYVGNTGDLDNVLALLYGTPVVIYYYRFDPQVLSQIRDVNGMPLEKIKPLVGTFRVKPAAAPAPGDRARALLQGSPSAATTQAAPKPTSFDP